MKTILLSMALLCISTTNAQWKNKKIKGNGNKVTITRNTESYDKIISGGSFKVELVSGKEGNITIKGDEEIISHIVTEVSGKTLKIGFEKNINLSYHSDIIITVPFQEISALSFSGSGEIVTKNIINAEDFELKLTGSGEGDLDIKATNLEVSVAGSGELKLSGKTDALDAKVTGSGNLNCSKLIAQNAEANVTGSGDMKVNCTNKLKAFVAGSGTIQYVGKPESLDSNIVGSGEITSF